MQLAVGDGGESDRRTTCLRCGGCGSTGERTLLEAAQKRLVGCDRRIDGAVWHAGRNGRSASLAQQAALKGVDIWRIGGDRVHDAAGQQIAEDTKSSAQYRLRRELPCNRRARLQQQEGGRRKELVATGDDRL